MSEEERKRLACPGCGKIDPNQGTPKVLCTECAAPKLVVAYLPLR